jgi:hypothetical protein
MQFLYDDSSMKIGSMLVIVVVVLAVLGAGLSYSGYNESLRVLTLTNTQSFTGTSTKTVVSTRTQYVTITTGVTTPVLDRFFSISAPSKGRCNAVYVDATLDAGKVHVSFHSEGGPPYGGAVYFWLLTNDEWLIWQRESHNEGFCETISYDGNSISEKPFNIDSSNSPYEFVAEIPTTAKYYFVFLNKYMTCCGSSDVSVAVHIDAIETRILTTVNEEIGYMTEATPFVAETTIFTTQPAGFGPVFYVGIGFLVAGVAVVIGRMKAGAHKMTVTRAWEVPPRPQESTVNKFCINCGASLPAHATVCNKCGSKQ